MTIGEMHYDFKVKLNKIDSQQNRNLLVPEIDWILNEAMGIYVRAIIQPKYKEEIENKIGFQINQRSIDDIRGESISLVKTANLTATLSPVPNVYIASLPSDYMFYLQKGRVNAVKGNCNEVLIAKEQQAQDLFEESPFDSSNFEWRECNIEINNNIILLHTDGTYTITNIVFRYFTKLPFIQNAQAYTAGGGQYYKPDGVTLLTGFTNCPLPSYVHYEIVDLAVAIASGQIQAPNYRIMKDKLTMTE